MSLNILIVLCLPFVIRASYFSNVVQKPCVSVPYWQCQDHYTGPVENGEGILDVRNTNDFDVCCPVECGKRKFPSQEVLAARKFEEEILGLRILGDNTAEFGEFPWMLGILEERTYRCGASLIHPQVAITAAHCVAKNSRYTIRAGESNWETTAEPLPHQDREVIKIIPHPNFNKESLIADIALLIVSKPFTLGENVGIICLPKVSSAYDTTRCVVAGWGRNSHKKGTYQSMLKKVELPIVPRDQCTKALQDIKFGPSFRLHQSFICAGVDKKDTCKGDGGSPLICPLLNQPDRYTQVGIVSWGLTCGVTDSPGVYVNVQMFVEWVDQVLKRLGFDSTLYKSN